MVTTQTPARSPLRTALLALLAVLAMLALIAGAYIWFIFSLDRQGDFHVTAAPADLDGDGDLDVLLHTLRNEAEFTFFPNAALWSNDGGRFSAEPFTPDYGGLAAAPADLNADGQTDLLLYTGHALRPFLGQSGQFRPQPTIPGPQPVQSQLGNLTPGDLDGDALPDALVTGCCGRAITLDDAQNPPNYAWVWLSAAGAVRDIPDLAGRPVRDAALGDLDSDGDLDLFVALLPSPTHPDVENHGADVLINDGSGQFSANRQPIGSAPVYSVALGDLDRDGDLDALVGDASGAAVWINQGGAQGERESHFFPIGAPIAGVEARRLFLADFDRDGDLDALAAGPQQASLWWNEGLGWFVAAHVNFRYSERHGITAADFTGDGWPDVFAAEGSARYRLWVNQGDGSFR